MPFEVEMLAAAERQVTQDGGDTNTEGPKPEAFNKIPPKAGPGWDSLESVCICFFEVLRGFQSFLDLFESPSEFQTIPNSMR